jgi:hypothetical protein
MTAPAPFPTWLADQLGSTVRWVIAPRLNARLRDKGYNLALRPETYAAYQAEHKKLLDLDRAERIALRLFPDDYHDGHDCMSEYQREGLPCRVCADGIQRWRDRVQSVTDALAAET